MWGCETARVGIVVSTVDRQYLTVATEGSKGGPPILDRPYAGGGSLGAAAAKAAGEMAGKAGVAMQRIIEVAELRRWHDCGSSQGAGALDLGHHWRVYVATVDGEPTPTPGSEWVDGAELAARARRTAAYAMGQLSEAEYAAAAGVDPMWVMSLWMLGILYVPRPRVLGAVEVLIAADLAAHHKAVSGVCA